MSPQGSNELNLLLKSKVVKIKVELDIKGSGLIGQVNKITTFLKDKRVKLKVELLNTGLKGQVDKFNIFLKDKKVKLGVEFKANSKDINSQITAINTLLKGNGFKKVKVDLDIDVKGSATHIKGQLESINKEISEFNKKYKKILEDTQRINQKFNKDSAKKSISTVGATTYANSVKEARDYMTQQFGKGIFSSTELKSAQGELTGFIGTLTKADGVIQKIRYEWNKESSTFTPINQTTITNTENNVAKAVRSLRELDKEILKLNSNQDKYWSESSKLQEAGISGTLTIDAVNALKTRIKEEQVLENKIREENALLRQQKELIAQINRAQRNSNSSSYKSQLGDLKSNVKNIKPNDVDANGTLKGLENSFKNLSQGYTDIVKKEKEYQTLMKRRKQLLNEIAIIEKTKILNYGDGYASKQYVSETKEMAKAIQTTDQYNEALKRMSKTNQKIKVLDTDRKTENQLAKLETVMYKYALTTNKSLTSMDARIAQVKDRVKDNLGQITYEIERYSRNIEKHNAKQLFDQRKNSIVPNANNSLVSASIQSNDQNALKQYISQLNQADVAMMKLTTDAKGVSRITAQFASTGKTAKQAVYEFDQVDHKLRQISTADVFNANRNLGFFEQLKIAMQRVPVWTIAMTAFYGSIRSVQNVTQEILKLDKAMTELRRVADSQIDVDHMFQGAVQLSKELGNNIHDVMQSVNDLARTFGHFNERQILAITNTATLMANVSDLNAQEATESLVGTMNAFNITAEDSIRIVDSMNEVDNNYAISTKQLAEGLSKSASTAKTFGVTMEENIGHITAIGAVTMESGSIIGNSLKTIYSRMTTMDGVADVFENLGISMKDSEGDARDVSEILGDLSLVWNDLSKAERQNIAVKVAGRYQLSRFLALMNNYSMAQEATTTALSSQGSATRENAKYLESFEARINSLKNSFTELSASIGKAFLESGLSVGIELLTSFANGITGIVDKVGILSVMFGALGLALYKFGALSFIWKSTSSSISSLTLGLLYAKDGLVTVGRTAKTNFTAVSAGAMTATQAVRGLGVAIKTSFAFLKGALISTGVLAGFVLLGTAIEYVVSKISEARQKSEELEKINQTMIKSFRDSGDGMESMLSRYTELTTLKEKDIELSAEQSSELTVLTNQFAEQLPFAVDYYNAQGEAILKSTDKIKEQIDAVAKLSQEQAKLKDMQLTENIKAEVEDYDKIAKNMKKVRDRITMLEEHQSKFKSVDNSKAIQKANLELMQLEEQRRVYMGNMTKLISEQTLAYVEAEGKMVGFGDSQQKLIENFASYNDGVLMATSSEEELAKTTESLVEIGKKVSTVFTDAYEIMSKNVDTDGLEELRTLLENVATSVPEDFLKNNKQEVRELTTGLKEFINVSLHVQEGSRSFELLKDRLMEVNFTEEEATQALYDLANQFDNTELRTLAFADGIEQAEDAISDMSQRAIEAIDPMEALFGYSSSDISGLLSNLQNMDAMLGEFGEGAIHLEGYQESVRRLVAYLGETPEVIKANIHEYTQLAEALQELKVTTDKNGNSTYNWGEVMAGMSGKTLELFKAWRDSGGLARLFGEEIGVATKSLENYNYEAVQAKEPYILGDIDVTPIEKLNEAGQEFVNFRNNATEFIKKGAEDINATVTSVSNTSEKLGTIKTDVKEVTQSTDDFRDSLKTTGDESVTQFGKIGTNVSANTDIAITAHDSHIRKLKEVDRQVQITSGNFAGLYTTIGNITGSLNSVQSAMSQVRTQASSLPSIRAFINQGYVGETTSNNVSDSVASAISSFSATAEGLSSSISSGGGEGTSGVIKSSIPSFVALHTNSNFYNAYNKAVSSASSKSSTKSSTTKKSTTSPSVKKSASKTTVKAEELAELYVIDLLDRKRTNLQGTLSQLEAKLSAISENSKSFRNAMAEVQKYEESILKINQQELANSEKRNKEIEKRLSALSNTSKHTKAQREEYNKLQQEYDSNLSKISQLKGEIESTIIELRKKTEEIFLDSVHEIINSLDRRIKTIADRIENTEFELEILDIVDPDNDIAKVDLLSTKVRDLYKEQWQYKNNMNKLEIQLRDAVAKYGQQSDAVKEINAEIEKNEEGWKNVRLELLRTEKQIRDLRGETVDEMIDSIKDYYDELIDKSNDAYDKEIKNAKEAHEQKMKMYEKESKRISELYEQRIKELDDEYNEDQYDEEVSKRNKELAKLQEKSKSYENDTSLEGRKKYNEYQEQIIEKQKELDDYIKKYQLDKLKEQLNEEKDMLLEKLEDEKKIDEEAHDILIEGLEKDKEAYEKHYKEIVDNEKEWSRIREELMKGNFATVKQLLSNMGIDLEQLADGTFDTLSEGFSNYSSEVRNFVTEINSMINSINAMSNSAYGKTTGISPNESVYTGNIISPTQVPKIITKVYAGEALLDPTPDKTQLYNLIKNSGMSEYRMNEIWRKAESGQALDVPTPDKMAFYNLFLDIIKNKKIGIQSFGTGGYTGDNIPSSGALAILDNKELVLNDKQTLHILDAVKLIDKLSSILPNISRGGVADKLATASEFTNNNFYELNVNIDRLSGDKDGATLVVKEIMKGLKKLGK